MGTCAGADIYTDAMAVLLAFGLLPYADVLMDACAGHIADVVCIADSVC